MGKAKDSTQSTMRSAVQKMLGELGDEALRGFVHDSMRQHMTWSTRDRLAAHAKSRTAPAFDSVHAVYAEATGKILWKTRDQWHPHDQTRPYQLLEELVKGEAATLDLLDPDDRVEIIGLVELVRGVLRVVEGEPSDASRALRAIYDKAVREKDPALIDAGRAIVHKHPKDSAAAFEEAAWSGSLVRKTALANDAHWVKAHALEAPRRLLADKDFREEYQTLVANSFPEDWRSRLCSGRMSG